MEVSSKPKIAFVCCYFNPCNYLSKYINFLMFYDKMYNDTLYEIYVIESYNNESKYRINKNCHRITSIYCEQTYWKKEQLLNLQINKIKSKYEYIGWLDCDINPTNPSWYNKLTQEVSPNSIIQICSTIKKHKNHFGDFYKCDSLSYAIETQSTELHDMLHFRKGEPGYGYVYPVSFLSSDAPLYDRAIAGSGDYLNFIGFLEIDNFDSFINSDRFFSDLREFKQDFIKWRHTTKKVNEIKSLKIELEVSYHGTPENRKYVDREHILRLAKYNPNQDLEQTTRLYKVKNKKALVLLNDYFVQRKEDDHLANSTDGYHLRTKISRLIKKHNRSFSINTNSFDFVNKLKTIKPKSIVDHRKQYGDHVVVGVKFHKKQFNLGLIECEKVLLDFTNTPKHHNYNQYYLQYIIENYENLPDMCFFVSENIHNNWTYYVNDIIFNTAGSFEEYPYTPLESVREIIQLNPSKHIIRKNEIRFSNYTFESWQKRYIGNHTLTLKRHRDGYTLHEPPSPNPMQYDPKHSFYVSKSYIRKHPLTVYKSLRTSVTKNEGKCEESVYMSFCWSLLLS